MAKPQLEDGYTPIANEILEQLVRMHLSANQWQVLLCVIRKTYGFHKKVDYIANFQIGEATGLCKAVVSRSLKDLGDRHLITRKGKYIGFQKDWEKWQGLVFQPTLGSKLAEPSTPEKLAKSSIKVSNSEKQLAKSATKVSSCAVAQKIKDTITKDKRNIPDKKKSYFFGNILLKEAEYNKLVDQFGEVGTKDRIENLSLYKKSRGKKYASDYATILAWDKKEKRGGQSGSYKTNSRQLKERENYTQPEAT